MGMLRRWYRRGRGYDGRTGSWTRRAMSLLGVSGSWGSAGGTVWPSWREIVGSMFWYDMFVLNADEKTFFASAKIGAILAVINPAYGEEELEFALRTVGTCRVFLN